MKKENKNFYNFITILLLLFLPIVMVLPLLIEWVIKQPRMLGISIHSIFNMETWFTFWPSYLGAIGTVALGCVALRQNETLSKANDELTNIQKDFFGSLTYPIIRFGELIDFSYSKIEDLEKNIKDTVDTKYPIVYEKFIEKYKIETCWHVRFSLPIENCSDIPLTCFKVCNFKWTINDKIFKFNNVLNNDMSKMPYKEKYNICNINIVYPDLENTDSCLSKCGSYIQFNIESNDTHKNFINSIIDFDLIIKNQAEKQKIFKVNMKLHKIERFRMHIDEYLIFPISD